MRHTRHSTLVRWGTHLGIGAVVGGFVLLGAVLVPVRATASPHEDHTVTICHRTNSVTNPYRMITVDFSAVDGSLGSGVNDHTGHGGSVFDFTADPDVAYPTPRNGDQWGDIIPPYQWGDDPSQSFPGMNWTDGQAILEAGCANPSAPTTQAPTTTTTTTTTTTDHHHDGAAVGDHRRRGDDHDHDRPGGHHLYRSDDVDPGPSGRGDEAGDRGAR